MEPFYETKVKTSTFICFQIDVSVYLVGKLNNKTNLVIQSLGSQSSSERTLHSCVIFYPPLNAKTLIHGIFSQLWEPKSG